jgi:hypothetical protein
MPITHAREFPRIESGVPVKCNVEGSSESGRALNLGGGGLLLNLSKSLAPSTRISLCFRPARHLPRIEATAEVRHELSGFGVGLEFTRICSEYREKIPRLILNRPCGRRQSPRRPLVSRSSTPAACS